VLTLVRRARRRFFCNELLSQGANAVSAAMAAFILLLLLGAQILDWRILCLIPLGAVAAGIYRARRNTPSPYVIAQRIDRRMGLSDTLSTAIHFRTSKQPVSDEIREFQFHTAQRVSETVDVAQAVPYQLPRTAYLMAVLVVVASSLFALRYGLSRSLDLRPPFARILEQSFGYQERTQQARQKRHPLPPGTPMQDPGDESALHAEQAAPEAQQVDPPAEEPPQAPGRTSDQKSEANQSRQEDQAEKASADQSGSKNPAGDASEASRQADPSGNQKGSKQDSSNQESNNENSSLLSKVKDAMQNLLSRMKPQANPSGSQQTSTEQNSKQGQGQQSGSKQESAKNGQQQSAGQQAGEQEGQEGDEANSSQDSQGKGTGKNNSQQSSKQPGSGVGSQNGDKSIRQAQQLAAMGKISEILGKRAANISGESTVEVQNTNQVLHTQYAQRGAQHTESGTEIHRDEVPVALEGYVEQYFERVRRPAPPKK